VFFDAGMILEPMDVAGLSSLTTADKDFLLLDDFKGDEVYSSAGIGLKIGWNENFIISVDHGRSFNAQYGKAGTYISLNYLF